MPAAMSAMLCRATPKQPAAHAERVPIVEDFGILDGDREMAGDVAAVWILAAGSENEPFRVAPGVGGLVSAGCWAIMRAARQARERSHRGENARAGGGLEQVHVWAVSGGGNRSARDVQGPPEAWVKCGMAVLTSRGAPPVAASYGVSASEAACRWPAAIEKTRARRVRSSACRLLRVLRGAEDDDRFGLLASEFGPTEGRPRA